MNSTTQFVDSIQMSIDTENGRELCLQLTLPVNSPLSNSYQHILDKAKTLNMLSYCESRLTDIYLAKVVGNNILCLLALRVTTPTNFIFMFHSFS